LAPLIAGEIVFAGCRGPLLCRAGGCLRTIAALRRRPGIVLVSPVVLCYGLFWHTSVCDCLLRTSSIGKRCLAAGHATLDQMDPNCGSTLRRWTCAVHGCLFLLAWIFRCWRSSPRSSPKPVLARVSCLALTLVQAVPSVVGVHLPMPIWCGFRAPQRLSNAAMDWRRWRCAAALVVCCFALSTLCPVALWVCGDRYAAVHC